MAGVASKVAVIGSGISGAVCASILAKNGVSVTVFESGRGPGGRMSQRRERCEDGKELLFDHGAPYFAVNASNLEVQSLVNDWESRGIVGEWKEKFGSFDFSSKNFVHFEEEGSDKRYVGVPGMNSICKALCHEPGIETKFGLGIGKLDWLDGDDSWSLTSLDGQNVGCFKGVVASDKSTFSSRFRSVAGKPPPIVSRKKYIKRRNAPWIATEIASLYNYKGKVCVQLTSRPQPVGNILDLISVSDKALQINEIPATPCFALMLAFEQPLSSVPTKGFSFTNSKILSWAFCDSSKPGRPNNTSECWVLHSTAEYAERIISQTGLQKPSSDLLSRVADELFQELQSTGLEISRPFFMKAHRWGSAFPAAGIAEEDKCLWIEKQKLAICGDFCVMPNVEGAISSGIAAAAKFVKVLSTL